MAIFSRPLPGTLPMTVKLLVAILIPSAIVSVTAGPAASMGFGLAIGLGMAIASVSPLRQGIILTLTGTALGTLASLADRTPWAIALLMFASAVVFAIANQRSAGLLSLAPVLVILFGPGPIQLVWWAAALWILGGALVGALITRILKFHAPAVPVARRSAWEHGIAVGLLTAGIMYWALAADIPHGYWAAVTVVMALRPLAEQRRETLTGRLVGTFLGAIIALVAVMLLPMWAAVVVAALGLFFLVWYSMGGAYLMQTLALTPMLLIFASLGDIDRGFELTVERVLFTLLGVVVAVVVALLLHWFEQRRSPASASSTDAAAPGESASGRPADGAPTRPAEAKPSADTHAAPAPDGLPISEYAFPGPLRDRLVAAIIAGSKTTTTSLLLEYQRENEPLPAVGDRAAVIDSAGQPVGIETVHEVRVLRLADVDLEHAVAEGEGHTTVAEWRADHEAFWHGDEFRAYLGDPAFTVDDDTLAVLVRFRFEVR